MLSILILFTLISFTLKIFGAKQCLKKLGASIDESDVNLIKTHCSEAVELYH